MSDPRYTDPLDPRRPAAPRPLEDDGGSGTMWSWIIGIIAIIVVAMMVYGYKPTSTAGNPPTTNSSTTTGAAPARPATPEPAPADTPR